MESEQGEKQDAHPVEQVLGYLNFSSGKPDPQFLSAMDTLFRLTQVDDGDWTTVLLDLRNSLAELEQSSPTFADAKQAKRILELTDSFFPAYFEYHQDLLAHQSPESHNNSLFVGRAVEALLASDPLDDDSDAVIQRAIRRLNDYIGYRPVATLESQKIEAYQHEWIRPTPLYVQGAGVAAGRYEEIVAECISILDATEPPLLRAAYFDPRQLLEMAIDPRAYDFDHPANKRPNYHFGHWDPHQISNDGFYTRFVIQQVTIDSLLKRITESEQVEAIAHEELVVEAAAVLAGTILMSSGISGHGPETHASTVSLGPLLGSIAAYRDEFYRQLIQKIGGSHGARLVQEATRLQQPFAAARQDLNRQLTACRALQLQRVQLARIYARMNYPEEATQQANAIQVPSARIGTLIDCELSQARTAIESGELAKALSSIEAARGALLRGIECGAVVDPWNILGFDANFSVFGPIENSHRDYRIDDLVDVIEEMHELYARLWSKAAATQHTDIVDRTKLSFEESAKWWHQFAAHELDTVDAEDPLEVFDAAENVAAALDAWHQEGEATGDIGFWAPHVQKFDSCRAYWLVVNTLLARDDKVAALGLLMHWLSQSDHIPLEHGETSFFRLSVRWLAATLNETGTATEPDARTGWKRIRKFFDYLEANAGEFWDVPEFEPDAVSRPNDDRDQTDRSDELMGKEDSPELDDPFAEEEEEDDDRFSAAYENVVYRDSTDDGMDGSVFDFDSHDQDYLQQASRPIVVRLAFIEQLALVWRLLAVTWSAAEASGKPDATAPATAELIHDLLDNAQKQLGRTAKDLSRLTAAIAKYKISRPGADTDAMVNYDRLRLLRDSLLDQVMNCQVSVNDALRFLTAASPQPAAKSETKPESKGTEEEASVALLRACLHGDAKSAASEWLKVRATLINQHILYVPLNRGGPAEKIAEVRARQQLVQDLLYWMPRLGLLKETYQLLEVVREMEFTPVGPGAITEFDDLFEVGCRSLVDALIDAGEGPGKAEEQTADADDWLVANMEDVMEPLLRSWLAHSRTLRLSVLEQVLTEKSWTPFAEFIKQYGRDLFTQRFLNLGNLRGILHQGVDVWLRMIEEREEPDYQMILDALEHGIDRDQFVEHLTLVLEAIVENYSEYRDYNSTTTQSDRGDLLYTLIDFLRLRVSYDRIVWNLRPVVSAHQVLANRGCKETAERWRSSLKDRIRSEAKRHMMRLAELQKKYAMQLPSISKRLSEKFMRPLMIDYLCSLIEPAMFHEDEAARKTAFDRISEQAEIFMHEPSGAGLDIPTWLLMMEDTIRAVSDQQEASLQRLLERHMLPPVRLSVEEVQSNIRMWETKLLEDKPDNEDDS